MLSALRQRPDLLPLAGRRRGEGILRHRSRRHGGVSVRVRAQYRDRLHAVDRPPGRQESGSPISSPRFRQFGRVFRPPQIFRIIEPVAGLPRITIRMRPTSDYGKPLTRRSLGSNHIRYSDEGTVIRLTTDAPLSLIDGEAPFILTRPLHLVFGPDEPFPGDLQSTCRDFRRPHPRLLDGMGPQAVDLLRLAGGDHPRRHHVEAQQLRRDRRDHRRPYHLDSGSAGLRPHLGLSLLLAARRLFRRAGAQPHRRDPNDGRIHFVYHFDRLEAGSGAAAAL